MNSVEQTATSTRAHNHYEQVAARYEQKVRETEERERKEIEEKRDVATDAAIKGLGQVVTLRERSKTGTLRLEQNLGCELPVCVANRREVNEVSIRFVTDEGLEWQLTRAADSKLPSPEYYKFWLWFLDRTHKAAEQGETKPPRIALIPAELARAFNISAADGRWYEDVDAAFRCFSRLIVSAHSVFYQKDRRVEANTTLGTLCFYSSWRTKAKVPENEACGWIAPGPLLWASIQDGYLLSMPFVTLQLLKSYIAQRLLTHLSKHCRPGGEYVVSLRKFLPKVPLKTPLERAGIVLKKHHAELVRVGFLSAMPKYIGRGKSRMVVYNRA